MPMTGMARKSPIIPRATAPVVESRRVITGGNRTARDMSRGERRLLSVAMTMTTRMSASSPRLMPPKKRAMATQMVPAMVDPIMGT